MNRLSINITSLEDLNQLLAKHQINTSLWKGVNPEGLYEDIKKGECVFKELDGKLLRKVKVVSVHCFHTNRNGERFKLIEEKQVIIRDRSEMQRRTTDGRVYDFVSETMKPDETPNEASVRALKEELQIEDEKLEFELMKDLFEKKENESSSYVGIRTRYKVYHFKTEIPEPLFKTQYVETEGGKETHFSWVKV